ncbi:ribonuclease III [Clostridium sp. DL1XJH146]
MLKDTNKLLLEFQDKLGVEFKDIGLLEIALTHSSYANEIKGVKFNERLEFLGDSVLQLSITEYLFKTKMNESEGTLTKKRALIVCGASLFTIATKWNLGKYIRMSKGEELTGGRTRTSNLANCVEAVIAAVYLEKGFEFAKEFILRNFEEVIEKVFNNEIILDYKTKLQEIAQKQGEININYSLIKFDGPPHRRKFYIEVQVGSLVSGKGEGYSKKESEQNAAKEALRKLGVDNG